MNLFNTGLESPGKLSANVAYSPFALTLAFEAAVRFRTSNSRPMPQPKAGKVSIEPTVDVTAHTTGG